MLHLDSRCFDYCDVKKGRGGSFRRRAGSIEHEDVNLADTFSRFAEKWRCTIGGQRRSQPIPIAYAAATSSARSLERLVTTTLAPSSNSARAVARPNPCTDAARHRRGQALRTVPTRSFAEQCVESHTWPLALSYRTPRYDTKLAGREKRALDDDGVRPACLLTVIHTPPNRYTLDGWLPMRPGGGG